MLPKVINVSNKTGEKIVGKLTSWQTKNGTYNVEHLAGMSPNSDLLTFWWSPQHDWQVVNVSQKTGQKIKSSVTSWQTKNGLYNVEHLAGMSPNSDLLTFWWSPQRDWQVVNVSQKTGQKIKSSVTSWQTKNGSYNVEHLAGVSPNGDLLAFWWSPQHDWQVVNVSQKTGQKIKTSVTSWQTKNGPYNVEHLAAMSPNGDLLTFLWSPQHDWQVVNVSQKTGQKIKSSVTSWQTKNGPYNVEHLAGMSLNGDLLTFCWSPQHDWQVVNTSIITNEKISCALDSYILKGLKKTDEILATKDQKGSLLLYWWNPIFDWQVINVSDITGKIILSEPCAWQTSSGNNIIEHLAAEGPNQELLVFWFDNEIRNLTESVQINFDKMKFQRNVRRKVVAILWSAFPTSVAIPSKADIENILIGSPPIESVRNYFLENSNNHFTIDCVAVLGWYQADKPYDHYFIDPPDLTDADGDHWIYGHNEKWAEGVIKASADFNFQSYNTNPKDIYLSTEELGILFVMPGDYPFGTNRSLLKQDNPPKPFDINGLKIDNLAEVYIGGINNWPLNLSVSAHELAHQLIINGGDMYVQSERKFGFFQPFEPGSFSIMGNAKYLTVHFDPFVKLKCGWLRPKIIFKSGIYTLTNIENSYRVFILINPEHSMKEYFIIENRWPSNYDKIPDTGLGVWHIIEDPSVYGEIGPPPNVTDINWSKIEKTDWGRRAIRMIRPNINSPYDDTQSLWDGSDPNTGYDLLSNDPNPNHPSLSWADGTPSGFAIRSISAKGASMTFTIDTPLN